MSTIKQEMGHASCTRTCKHTGVDNTIQRPTEYIYEYERNSFPTQSVTIKLRKHKSTPAQQKPRQKKIGEYAGAGLEPTTYVQGRRPKH